MLESVSKYQTVLLELYEEYRSQITKCNPEDFELLYDALAEDYAKAGYQEIVNERRAAYRAGKSTKLVY